MPATCDIVVSVENSAYHVWQAMLFHYSCSKHLGRPPIVVVHKDNEPLQPGFERIVASGGNVQTAPNYRSYGGDDYAPRNTSASLRHVVSQADFLFLCDPDMIFLRGLNAEDLQGRKQQISFDYVEYLDPDRAEYQPALDQVCRRANVEPSRLRQQPIRGGVPHLIPRHLQEPLSSEWLHCIDLFPAIAPRPAGNAAAKAPACASPRKHWVTTMWALVLAVHRLGLEAATTHWCILNFEGDRPLPTQDAAGSAMIHYCYSEPGFNKSNFESTRAAEELVWNVPADDGTINGAIRKQLREAAAFFGIR
jgi:hypothetical protein